MKNSNKILVGGGILIGLAYLASKAKATPPTEGTLNIISCTPNQTVDSGSSATIDVSVQAVNGNVTTSSLKIVAGNYTDTKSVTLDMNQTTTVTFTIPNITQATSYTVSVI